MKFEIQATVTETYIVEAEDLDAAIEIASDRTEPDYTTPQGFTYARNLDTNEDRIF